jgi:hypothetical protein
VGGRKWETFESEERKNNMERVGKCSWKVKVIKIQIYKGKIKYISMEVRTT